MLKNPQKIAQLLNNVTFAGSSHQIFSSLSITNVDRGFKTQKSKYNSKKVDKAVRKILSLSPQQAKEVIMKASKHYNYAIQDKTDNKLSDYPKVKEDLIQKPVEKVKSSTENENKSKKESEFNSDAQFSNKLTKVVEYVKEDMKTNMNSKHKNFQIAVKGYLSLLALDVVIGAAYILNDNEEEIKNKLNDNDNLQQVIDKELNKTDPGTLGEQYNKLSNEVSNIVQELTKLGSLSLEGYNKAYEKCEDKLANALLKDSSGDITNELIKVLDMNKAPKVAAIIYNHIKNASEENREILAKKYASFLAHPITLNKIINDTPNLMHEKLKNYTKSASTVLAKTVKKIGGYTDTDPNGFSEGSIPQKINPKDNQQVINSGKLLNSKITSPNNNSSLPNNINTEKSKTSIRGI